MSVHPILRLGHPALRTPCRPIKRVDDRHARDLAIDLRDTLEDFRAQRGFGRGIAAPQIGDSLRMIVINLDQLQTLINPVITRRSRTRVTLWDDCFSFPDLLVKVRRHLHVDVRYQDQEGRTNTVHASGPLAELLQHELDHLDGILAIDRAIDSRHIIYRSEYEAGFAGRGLPPL